MEKNTKILAFYLPQFHPTPENDEWWGKGFTEWTNVGKAKKLFPGHIQPKVPADLGYYDLRVPETRIAQAALAKEAGIDGFCYWHYWFEPGKELLQRPFNEVLKTKKPDYPFCLAWANESWYAKLWNKDTQKDKLLIEQKYLGIEDYTKHFYSLLEAFNDDRYVKYDGKPVFVIYKPLASPEIKVFMDTWQGLAKKEGFPGIYFIAHHQNTRKGTKELFSMGFDSVNICVIRGVVGVGDYFSKAIRRLLSVLGLPKIYSYKKSLRLFFNKDFDSSEKVCPTIITGWDHTPRSGKKGLVMVGRTPTVFKEHVNEVLENAHGPFIFVKSWNEWAEGNYLEPDLREGKAYLNVFNEIVRQYR